MLMISRRTWILALGMVVVAGAAVVVGSTSVGAASSTDWSLNSTQLAQARQALMLMATESDPETAGKDARAIGAWPSNIASGRAFGTDRATANAAMGEPKAAPATDTRRVVCAEGRGRFSTVTTPRPQGSPAQTFTYAVICFDPATGDILDSGYDDKPVTGTFSSIHTLDVTTSITSVVK